MEIDIFEGISLTDAQIDKENLIIRNVAVLNKNSKNKRQYSEQALNEAVEILKGIPSYFNHSMKRDVRDLLGQFNGMRRAGDGVRGDLQLIESSRWVLDVAARTPSAVGFSINAVGRTRKDGEIEIVESILKATSIDLVADPATTKSIFEEKKMADEESKKLQEENKALLENLKKIQEENEVLVEKNKKVELKEQATKKLPQYAVTDAFIDQLTKAQNPENLIEERLNLIENVKKSIIIKGNVQKIDSVEITNKEIKEGLT